jgi:hypothetical protein
MTPEELKRRVTALRVRTMLDRTELPEPDENWYDRTKPCKYATLLSVRRNLSCMLKDQL